MSHTQTPLAVGFRAVREHNAAVKPNSDVLAALRSAVPQFFDADGAFRRDAFDAELNASNAQEIRDGYRLNFIGKDYARLQCGQRSETLLVPDAAHNAEPENAASGNVFITGDNLEVFRHLANAYKGNVKVIYIDPPYNTGKEFVYSDNFEWKDDALKEMLGYSDDDIKRLKSIQGRSSHSAWLAFMYPRLKLAQRLLADDGVMFVSIDDNEQANLKFLMDDVFGEEGFVGQYIWHKKLTGGYDNKNINIQHEYILVYSRIYSPNLLTPETKESSYTLVDEDGRKYKWDSLWNVGGLTYSPSLDYPITAPDGTDVWPTGQKGIAFWLWSKDKVEQNREKLKFEKTKNGAWRIKKRVYASDGLVSGSMLDKEVVKGNTHSSAEIKNLFNGNKIFDYAKPTPLIKYLISRGTLSSNDSIILDFFAGSATTAHAVMQLNAEDGGNRKFIMVQLDEPTASDSEARKAGYHTIDEISRERIKRAAKKIREESPMFVGDLGFRHYRVAPLDVVTLEKIEAFDPAALQQADMFEDMAAKIGVDAILATWMVADGYALTDAVQEIDIAGYTAHYLGNSLLYLIAGGWGKAQTETLLNLAGERKLNLNTVVVFGYSFGMESMRELEINIKQLPDNTEHPVQIEKRF